jgi:glycosyltransferase involved in cell wall biosynthesis
MDVLGYLLTDAWFPPSSLLAKMCGHGSKLADRFHDELGEARVKAFNSSSILFETLARACRLQMWPSILARNRWFQRRVVSFLRSQLSTVDHQRILLSYSYTALEPFRYAKVRGWKTVLVQIDPGPEEEKIVAGETARVPELAGEWRPAPAEYWARWREECELADRIIVNSEWSREGLIRGGVPGEKISVVPLAYEIADVRDHTSDIVSARTYAARFTFERPLRVLFLGLINLRKGVARLLEAARILHDEPVEFWMVGPVEIANVSTIAQATRVQWFGPATRGQAGQFYRNSDVFILPTLSDGFAITQLEAQAYGLPIIASKFCGRVVENNINGIILDEPSAACIAHAIRDCIANPYRLERLASASRVHHKFTIQALAHELQHLEGPRDSPG